MVELAAASGIRHLTQHLLCPPCKVFPGAKHQICYWHAIKYIEERLTTNKPPAAYDPRKAHKVFSFIDPTWAPGVTQGDVKEYLDGRDVEADGNEQGGVREHLEAIRETEVDRTLLPRLVLKAGDRRIPVWPDPPAMKSKAFPVFCPPEYHEAIVEKFRVHLHQHPAIPFNDVDGTYLRANEIHEGAVSDMYHWCYKRDLSQTTMIVESTWRVIKHQDLGMFNRPRIDLVAHLLITKVRNRTRNLLDTLLDKRRQGRGKTVAPWQWAIREQWLDMSKPDELRLIERELTELYKPAKTKGRAERLVLIRNQAEHPAGSYHMDIHRWTCSCPSYLISCFLLCKHLVRAANSHLNLDPKRNLEFFAELRRHHQSPFYHLPGLHKPVQQPLHFPSMPKKILRYEDEVVEVPPSEAVGSGGTGEKLLESEDERSVEHGSQNASGQQT
ncbi:hypothetical protein OE88DRAFT_1649504, partial [Heliocybe sulcata]